MMSFQANKNLKVLVWVLLGLAGDSQGQTNAILLLQFSATSDWCTCDKDKDKDLKSVIGP